MKRSTAVRGTLFCDERFNELDESISLAEALLELDRRVEALLRVLVGRGGAAVDEHKFARTLNRIIFGRCERLVGCVAAWVRRLRRGCGAARLGGGTRAGGTVQERRGSCIACVTGSVGVA